MGRGSVWERRVRLARREEEADPQRSVTDKQRRQRALPSQTLRAAGLSGLDCIGSGGTDRRRSAPPLTALPKPEFPSRRTPPQSQTGSQRPKGILPMSPPAPPILLIIFWNLPILRIISRISSKRLSKLFTSVTVTPEPLAMR
jgi:hypothetical protein